MRSEPVPAATPSGDEAVVVAKQVGLRYVRDDRPGISRRANGQGFRYLDPEGRPLHDEVELARIKSLVIPPAWTEVRISPWQRCTRCSGLTTACGAWRYSGGAGSQSS